MPRFRVPLFVWAVLVVVGLFAASFTACVPAYAFGDAAGDSGPNAPTNGGDASTDATLDSSLGSPESSTPFEASTDAGQDSAPTIPFDGGINAVVLADAGPMVGSTGFGYQIHLIYAQNGARYWFFYVDDTTEQIETLVSSDFVTWTASSPIVLGGNYTIADGENFSVAYANIAGKDVVHLVVNADAAGNYMTLHVRAMLSGNAITASAPIALAQTTNGGECPNDAPATVITPAGRVYDVTAWTSHPVEETTCDTDIYLSPGTDVGTSWDAGTFGYDGYYVSLPTYAFSHDLVTLPDAGLVMLLYPDEDNSGTTLFDSIGWALSSSFDGGEPGQGGGVDMPTGDELFNGTGKTSAPDDWTACRLGGSEVHVVRHVLNGSSSVDSFQEDVFDGVSWTQSATPPAAVTGVSGTGVVLLSGADPSKGMLLVTVGFDGAINVAKWTAAGGWTQAAKLAGNGNPRQSLSGTGCGSVRPTVLWTETIGPANVIESADLEGFLQ